MMMGAVAKAAALPPPPPLRRLSSSSYTSSPIPKTPTFLESSSSTGRRPAQIQFPTSNSNHRNRGVIFCMTVQPTSASVGVEMDGHAGSAPAVGQHDLLIVGPGVLGRIVADQWKKAHPNCQVFGQTFTTDHHKELIEIGISPLLRGSSSNQFPYVIFCAPPSRSGANYAMDVRMAASNWSGEGSFLFTSSSAAYNCFDNGPCDEDSAVVPVGGSPRTDVLLNAEADVLKTGGCILRLAGLYKLDRGAHVYWLEKGTVDSRPDHIVNLIHYEDAASLLIAILGKRLRGRIFLGCDNHPMSRQEIMDCVDRSGKFSKKFQAFTGTSDPLGKRLDNSKTRTEIGWQPKYPSFPQFLCLQE